MKKALAIILTISLLVLGSTFVGVSADSPDGNPDWYPPYTVDQG